MSAVAIVHPKLAQACFERAIQPLLTRTAQYEGLGIHLRCFAFPFLDVDLQWRARGHAIGLRVEGWDYPYRPVSGYWIDEVGERLLPGRHLVPTNAGFHTADQFGSPATWFCFRGWREYHDHQSHQDTSWATLRSHGGYAVPQLIQQLHWDLNNAPGVTPI